MKSIGVRDLRQRASQYLRQVEAGQTLEVTAATAASTPSISPQPSCSATS